MNNPNVLFGKLSMLSLSDFKVAKELIAEFYEKLIKEMKELDSNPTQKDDLENILKEYGAIQEIIDQVSNQKVDNLMSDNY